MYRHVSICILISDKPFDVLISEFRSLFVVYEFNHSSRRNHGYSKSDWDITPIIVVRMPGISLSVISFI